MAEIELSVVTGTYNRLPHMQRMVQSVRQSIGVGIPYEIVLVDGGSTDGTIEWCKTQPDIVLIEQGELLGAIKAFNAGLYAARGRYCVVGNDDIEYIEDTLPRAVAFMQDHPNVGVGCFYQDRDHPGQFTLSYMPAIMNQEQVNHVYGQVCIVPRWLGDEVGWWGDFPDMRTYGGDNNLSCFVLERGYRVTGVKCACIHDLKVEDDLRRINNDDRVKGRHSPVPYHPDSVAWGKHWSHEDGTSGPIVRMDPYMRNPLERKMRFLYLPIYELGHDIQRRGKRGLRNALANAGMVYEFDWLKIANDHGAKYMMDYFRDMIDTWEPDIILTQIHTPDPNMFNSASIQNIRHEFPEPGWVNWNGDYHPEDLLSVPNINMCRQFDLQCVVTTSVRSAYAKAGVAWMYWQIGYEESDAQPDGTTPHYDVLFLGNGYSAERMRLGRLLRQFNSGIYGSWGDGFRSDGYNLYDFDAGQRLYRAAKLSVGDNQWGNRAVGFTSNRLFQAMSAGGSMFMQQYIPDLDKLLGLVDGQHYIMWQDMTDLARNIKYWLDPARDAQRQHIADQGRRFIRTHHSFDNRVAELLEVLVV